MRHAPCSTRGVPMRAIAVLLALLAACSGSQYPEGLTDIGSGEGANGAAAECQTDGDCVLAAARCCDCPTFAMPVDPAVDICAGVTCPVPGPTCAANVHAACVQSTCELACDAIECDQSCPDGFAVDASGCATCACLEVADRTCTASTDCVEVPADCCGCAKGGMDTAVPSADAPSNEAGLDCPSSPACPGVSTCQADLSPQCVQGTCALQPALPATACGRPDLPPCGAGTICALNVDPQATAQGVGVCVPPT